MHSDSTSSLDQSPARSTAPARRQKVGRERRVAVADAGCPFNNFGGWERVYDEVYDEFLTQFIAEHEAELLAAIGAE